MIPTQARAVSDQCLTKAIAGGMEVFLQHSELTDLTLLSRQLTQKAATRASSALWSPLVAPLRTLTVASSSLRAKKPRAFGYHRSSLHP